MRLKLNSKPWPALLCLAICSGIFVSWGSYLASKSFLGLADFKAVYYGARCLIDHADPYQPAQFETVYRAEGEKLPSDPDKLRMFRMGVFEFRNLPSAMFLLAPLAMLPFRAASVVWMSAIVVSFTLAAFLMWNVAERHAPRFSTLLVCFLLANTVFLVQLANTAGIVIGLCIVAVWSFLQERFVLTGVVCMAVALAMKPHDAGFVWLYFLLAGGAHRKRALQTLAVVAALVLPSILWVSHVAPQWAHELHANLASSAARGSLNDPGPTSVVFGYSCMVINLQSAIAIFRNDPGFYNVAAYLVCGTLLLLLAVRILRARFSKTNAWFALASISAFSMLPVFHRLYDAKLLLLTVPACAMLWAESGPLKWPAGLLNAAALVVTGDVPSTILVMLAKSVSGRTGGFTEKMLDLILLRPVAPILLATGIFYLWVYSRRTAPGRELKESGGRAETAEHERRRAVSHASA